MFKKKKRDYKVEGKYDKKTREGVSQEKKNLTLSVTSKSCNRVRFFKTA